MRFAPSIPGWSSVDLVKRLQRQFKCPVRIENDADLAAVAVAHEQGCQGTLVVVHWGERIGAGVVLNGRLHRGAGEAGEIGFIRPGAEPLIEEDGRGALERTIGAEAIVQLARRRATELGGSLLVNTTDAASVFRAASEGDPAAVAVVNEVAKILAEALAPAILLLSPHALVIAGGVARAGQILRQAVAEHLRPLTLTPPAIALSEMAKDTVLTGAFRIALDEVWREKLSGLHPRPAARSEATSPD